MPSEAEPTRASSATEPSAFPPRSQPKPENPQTRQALLPPFSVTLAMSATQDLAKAVVTQTFRNDAPKIIEKGTYQFPIPHESSVVDFKCQIGARKILQTQVKPRLEARETFNKAVKKGHSAGLVEQNSPEIFRTELGNIPAHTTVEVKLSFIFFLKHTLSNNTTTTVLTIPTYIAPRYGDPGFELHKTGPLSDTKLSVNIDVLTSTEIRDIRSDTHKVIVERGSRQRRCRRWADFVAGAPPLESTSASVRLDDELACLDRDFILVITAQPSVDEELPHATFESHPDAEGSSALMLEIPPSFMLRDQTLMDDTEMVFLADRSGSMLDKIPGLKSSLEFFLRGLPRTRFNLYCFGSNYTSLWPASRPYNDDTLNEALRYVSHFTNDMGGTDLLPALESLVGPRGKGSLDVIVLTDGEVWRLQETIDFVRKTHIESKGAVRFFSMGIGNAVSHELVEGIANAGGGYAEIIPLASSEGWEARMVAVLKAAMTGHVSGFGIEVDGIDINYKGDTDTVPTLQISPRDISNLSPFVRNRIFILAENKQLSAISVVKIKRRSLEGYETATPVQLYVPEEQDSTLHKFAARALLSDLGQAKDRTQHGREAFQRPIQDDDLIRKEGERLGCRYSLVSKWTSFVAVEIIETNTNEPASNKRDYATSISSDVTIAGLEQLDTEDMNLLCMSLPRQLRYRPRTRGRPSKAERPRLTPSINSLTRSYSPPALSVQSTISTGTQSSTAWFPSDRAAGHVPFSFPRYSAMDAPKYDSQPYTTVPQPSLDSEIYATKSSYSTVSYGLEESRAPYGSTPTNGPPSTTVDQSFRIHPNSSNEDNYFDSIPFQSYTPLVSPYVPEENEAPYEPPTTYGAPSTTVDHSFPNYSNPSNGYEYFASLPPQSYSPLASPSSMVQNNETSYASPSILAATLDDCPPAKLRRGRASPCKGSGRKVLGPSFIYDVLRFQKSNGAFEIPRKSLERVLKLGMHGIVRALLDKGLDYDLAVTAITVVLLQNKLAQHRGLWVRMVEKAKEYIQSQVENGKAVDDLLETAQSMLNALDEEGNSQDKDTEDEDVKAEEATIADEIEDL
ncbi:von Willebrand factor type A domain-containing protein [Aspergillus insuetus]